MPEQVPEVPPAVLVVEADEALSRLLEFAFRRWGVNSHIVGTGAKAVEVCRQRGPEIGLVLCEVVLPDIDGPTTLAALRAVRPDLRCWFMGGIGGAYTEPELLACGADGLLHKPFELKSLRAILEPFIGPTSEPMAGVERRTARAKRLPSFCRRGRQGSAATRWL